MFFPLRRPQQNHVLPLSHLEEFLPIKITKREGKRLEFVLGKHNLFFFFFFLFFSFCATASAQIPTGGAHSRKPPSLFFFWPRGLQSCSLCCFSFGRCDREDKLCALLTYIAVQRSDLTPVWSCLQSAACFLLLRVEEEKEEEEEEEKEAGTWLECQMRLAWCCRRWKGYNRKEGGKAQRFSVQASSWAVWERFFFERRWRRMEGKKTSEVDPTRQPS